MWPARCSASPLTSLPFASYGGVVADSEAVADRLEREAVDLARQLGVEYLELRQVQARKPGRPAQDLYVTFKRAIPPVLDEAMLCIPQKRRNMVRKALKLGLQVVEGDSLDNFFPAFFENAHNHGTPLLPRRGAALLRRRRPRRARPGRQRLQVLGADAARLRARLQGLRLRPQQGRHRPLRFKKNWGFEPQPLSYEYRLYKRDSIPQNNPMNPKYRAFIALWKRLPIGVANRLGPHIVRNLG
jgi:hypothetical protein